MARVLIDPLIVAVPTNVAELKNWVRNILLWTNEAENSTNQWFYSRQCLQNLMAENLYPLFDEKHKSFFLKNGLNSNDITIIVRRFGSIFQNRNRIIDKKISFIEESITGQELLTSNTEITPDEFLARQIEANKITLSELLAFFVVCKKADNKAVNDLASDLHIATLKLSGELAEIEVKTTVELAIPELNLGENEVIEGAIPLLFSPNELPSDYVKLIQTIKTGQDLWNNQKFLFPSLEFCAAVENQLQEVQKGDKVLNSIIKRLQEFESAAKNWTSGNFDSEAISGSPRNESESTAKNKKFVRERTFMCPDGVKREFLTHCSLSPDYWRLHFIALNETRKVIIGYIGPHLPITSNPT